MSNSNELKTNNFNGSGNTRMLKKGTINPAHSSPKKFLSPMFLVPKKDSWQRVVLNLKKLNLNLPYAHSKMEGLFLLKKLLQENKYMGKADLKDPYFSVPGSLESQNGKVKVISLSSCALLWRQHKDICKATKFSVEEIKCFS